MSEPTARKWVQPLPSRRRGRACSTAPRPPTDVHNRTPEDRIAGDLRAAPAADDRGRDRRDARDGPRPRSRGSSPARAWGGSGAWGWSRRSATSAPARASCSTSTSRSSGGSSAAPGTGSSAASDSAATRTRTDARGRASQRGRLRMRPRLRRRRHPPRLRRGARRREGDHRDRLPAPRTSPSIAATGSRSSVVMTDNGSAYRSAVHAIACRTLGIRHLRTRPYRPQTNGKAERFIRTMLGGWVYSGADLPQLGRAHRGARGLAMALQLQASTRLPRPKTARSSARRAEQRARVFTNTRRTPRPTSARACPSATISRTRSGTWSAPPPAPSRSRLSPIAAATSRPTKSSSFSGPIGCPAPSCMQASTSVGAHPGRLLQPHGLEQVGEQQPVDDEPDLVGDLDRGLVHRPAPGEGPLADAVAQAARKAELDQLHPRHRVEDVEAEEALRDAGRARRARRSRATRSSSPGRRRVPRSPAARAARPSRRGPRRSPRRPRRSRRGRPRRWSP